MFEAVNRLYLLVTLLILLPTLSLAQIVTGQHPNEFDSVIAKNIRLKYLLFLPQDYLKRKEWPLIMYLHGGSRRGDDLEKLTAPGFGLPALLKKEKTFPFVVVCPLCPVGEYWTDTDSLNALLDEVMKRYSIDPDRVYLTGHSMGGRGTWYLAYEHPEKFAAIAPMSGLFLISAWAERLSAMPIWAIQGERDRLAPASEVRDLISAVRACGNNDARLTILPNRGHNILDVYENWELYSWFLQHRRHSALSSTSTVRSAEGFKKKQRSPRAEARDGSN